MKYGQVWSAHWEGGVGEWLRGQLEARGIDALAYGRYVLSLLTRPLDPADLSPQPTKNWERRRISEWAPVKIEALKRSAAVQCLINASDDQSSGIEQLVDELRAKLKEADELNAQTGKREAKPRRESRTLSPSEMARLYYAAFPALASASAPGHPAVAIPRADDPAALIPLPRRAKDNGHRRNVSCGKDWLRPKQAKQQAPRVRRNTVHSHRHQNARCRNRKRERQASEHGDEPLPEWITDGDVWDADGRDRLRDFIRGMAPDDGYGTCDNTTLEESAPTRRLYQRDSDTSPDIEGEGDDIVLFKDWVIKENLPSPPLSPSEEESIARFEAKFDHSLEALWFTDNDGSPDATGPEPVVEFRDFFSSPCGDGFASFCGSVWSNGDLARDRDANAFTSLDETCGLESLVSDPRCFRESGRDLWRIKAEPDGEESMEVIYGRLKPLNLGGDEDTCNVERMACPFIPGIGMFSETVPGPLEDISFPDQVSHRRGELSNASVRSLTALNHSSLYSSFTEVVPKAPGFIGDTVTRKNFKIEVPREIDCPPATGDEEDLLTSVRTHFRPIERQSPEGAKDRVVNYANGVTFPVDSALDEVEFKRSGSGTIFLETGRESPERYMEYRTQGIDYSRLDVCLSSACSDEEMSPADLVLKFRVCQIEKSIQTEGACAAPEVEEVREPSVDPESHWIQCEGCEANGGPWTTEGRRPFRFNAAKIWGSADEFCEACDRQRAEARANRRRSGAAQVRKEELAREWDELLSDISNAHNFPDGNGCDTPDDIATEEISFRADDGDFVRIALEAAGPGTDKDPAYRVGRKADTVGGILDRSLSMYSDVEPHCEACADDCLIGDGEGKGEGRKRRHSAAGGGRAGGTGKLRCTLPPPPIRPLRAPLLTAADRPLTR